MLKKITLSLLLAFLWAGLFAQEAKIEVGATESALYRAADEAEQAPFASVRFSSSTDPNVKKVVLQGFWWDYHNNNFNNSWANYLTELAPRLKSMGIDAVWVPASYKNTSTGSVGYSPMDHYDLGDKFQKGNIRTRMGTKDELLRMIAVLHANGIEVIEDVVLNHVDGAGSGNGNGGQDPHSMSMATANGFKNFRYTSYATPAIDESQNDYWTRRGRWAKNYTNFHPNGNNNCTSGDICESYWGPDIDYSFNSQGPSSNIPTSGAPAGYPVTRGFHNPSQPNDYMYNNAADWMKWLKKQTDFDGFRWDAVKHFPVYVQRDLTRHVKYNADWANGGNTLLNFGEWIGSGGDLDNYVVNMAQPSLGFGYEEHTGTFDLNLRAYGNGGSLYAMVTQNSGGAYPLANLPSLQQGKRFTDYAVPVMQRVHRTMPFVNSHDTYRPFLQPNGNFLKPLGDASGWNTANELGGNGNHIDPREPRMPAAYATILAMDGNPIVFFEDVFNIGTTGKRWTHMPTNTTDLPIWNDLGNLIQCHNKLGFKNGNYKVRSNESGAYFPAGSFADDHLVIERSGKAVIGINDQFSAEQQTWIDTDFPAGTKLMDYSGANGLTVSTVQADKRALIKTKGAGHTISGAFGHGYSVWAPVPNNVAFTTVAAMFAHLNYTPNRATTTTQEWEMDNDLGDSHCSSLGQGGRTPDFSYNARLAGKIFVEAGKIVSYEVFFSNPSNALVLEFFDLNGKPVHKNTGATSLTGSFTNATTRWLSVKVRNATNTTLGQKCWVKVTYTAPQTVSTAAFPASNPVSIWTGNAGSDNFYDCKNWEEGKIPACSGTVVVSHPTDFMPKFGPCYVGNFTNYAGLSFKGKAVLAGAYNATTGLMSDSLRVKSLIPLVSPYDTSDSTVASVFTTAGANGVVDWVLIELRDANAPQTILHSESALLQRDGDIVNRDGISPVWFNGVDTGQYFVSIRHRNHLRVMSGATQTLGSTIAQLDFKSSTGAATFGSHAQQTIGSVRAMWAGDANSDGKVVYSGTDADLAAVLAGITANPSNTAGERSFPRPGYHASDLNMDGRAIYQGKDADVLSISRSVFAHPANTTQSATFTILQQIN